MVSANDSTPAAAPDRTTDQIRALFRDRDLRFTKQREVVYRALAGTKSHPTAEELFALAGGREYGISLATVYNTLEAFTASGLARRIPSPSGNGACRFDADTRPHVHVRMPDGRLADVPAEIGSALLKGLPAGALDAAAESLGVEIEGVEIELVARPRRATSENA